MKIRNPGSLHRLMTEVAHQAKRATKLEGEIAHWAGTIVEREQDLGEQRRKLEECAKALEELKSDQEQRIAAFGFARDQMHDYRELVIAACAENGWPLPEQPTDPELHQTGEFRIVTEPPTPLPPPPPPADTRPPGSVWDPTTPPGRWVCSTLVSAEEAGVDLGGYRFCGAPVVPEPCPRHPLTPCQRDQHTDCTGDRCGCLCHAQEAALRIEDPAGLHQINPPATSNGADPRPEGVEQPTGGFQTKKADDD